METLRPTIPLRQSYLLVVLIAVALPVTGGCRICADCEELSYPAYGGAWHRTIRDSGRVGSTFDPAGARAFDLAARDQPEHADQLQRRRYKARGSGIRDPELYQEEGQAEQERRERDEANDELKLQERENKLRDRQLEDIEIPSEKESQDRTLEEIDRRIIPGQPSPPVL